MRSNRSKQSVLRSLLLLSALSVACGDDTGSGAAGGDTSGGGGAGASGSGGSGAAGAAGGSGGQGATGGSGGEGATGGTGTGGSPPEGAVFWTVDGNSHETTAAMPPGADVQKPNPAVLTLTISATDAATFDSINAVVSVSAPSVMDVLAAGTYPCAPAGQLPSVTINAAEGGVVYGSTGALADCSITFDEDVNVGTPVKGTASGTLDGNGAAVDFTMAFNLEDIPG